MFKSMYEEVAEALGKSEIDDEVVDKTSDILKYTKALEMLEKALSWRARESSTRMIKKALTDGTRDLYNKVLLGRRNGQQV